MTSNAQIMQAFASRALTTEMQSKTLVALRNQDTNSAVLLHYGTPVAAYGTRKDGVHWCAVSDERFSVTTTAMQNQVSSRWKEEWDHHRDDERDAPMILVADQVSALFAPVVMGKTKADDEWAVWSWLEEPE